MPGIYIPGFFYIMENSLLSQKVFPGLQLRLVRLGNVDITFAFPHHRKYDYNLVAIVDGVLELVYTDVSYPARPAELHLLTAECVLRRFTTSPAEFWLLCFSQNYVAATVYHTVSGLVADLLKAERFPLMAQGSRFKTVRKLLQLLNKHQGGDNSDNSPVIAALTFNLLLSCFAELRPLDGKGSGRHLHRSDYVVFQFRRLLKKNVCIRHDVGYYAAALFMSKGNFTKVVRQATGKTPKAHIETALISLAEQLLYTTVESIYVIAERLGFKSSSAFINFFRARTGSTPNDFRNRIKRRL